MSKKEKHYNVASDSELRKQLCILVNKHYKLNKEVDNLNTQVYSLSSEESTHLRHIKLKKLKLKDRIEGMRIQLQYAD
jgi:hypothetical protein